MIIPGKIGFDGSIELLIPQGVDYGHEKPSDINQQMFFIQYFPNKMENRGNFKGWKCIEAQTNILTF